ncbi:MAG: universal stress protein [Gemmatimonadota bacterium]
MIVYANILLATDFSDAAREAARHAAALARACQASLHALHVVEDFAYWEQFSLRHFPSPEVYDELKRNARLALDDLFAADDRPALAVQAHVRQGKAFLEVIRTARDVEADVIVVGSHGQSGLAETLFGSTAERIVRKAPCAVLVVRHPEHTFAMP